MAAVEPGSGDLAATLCGHGRDRGGDTSNVNGPLLVGEAFGGETGRVGGGFVFGVGPLGSA